MNPNMMLDLLRNMMKIELMNVMTFQVINTMHLGYLTGCIDSGLTETNCNDIKDNPQNIENHEALQATG